jgi:hypothetical protein
MPDPSLLRSRAELAASIGASGSKRAEKLSGNKLASDALLGAIAPVTVDAAATHQFPGAIRKDHAEAILVWLERDAAPDQFSHLTALLAEGKESNVAVDAIATELSSKVDSVFEAISDVPEAIRRITVQMGGDEVRDQLSLVMRALRNRPLIEKAGAFGKATNAMTDDETLATALKSMPLDEPAIMPLLMQAAVAQSAAPAKLTAAAVRLADSPAEASVRKAGFGSLVEAILALAQDQIANVGTEPNTYTDTDLTCRAVDRFHRLMRAINTYLELERGSDWAQIVTDLTRRLSARIEPRLRTVTSDLSQSMRKPRNGDDRLDSEKLLSALNGIYLLATVRNCRDSLAVNALYDQVWTETGQLLEALVNRTLEQYRENPGDEIASARLDTGIKMAEVRFNGGYADILRRARDSVDRRVPPEEDQAAS